MNSVESSPQPSTQRSALTPAELESCAARLREALTPHVSPAICESLVGAMMCVLEEQEDE